MSSIKDGINKIFDNCYSKELSDCPKHTIFQRQKALNGIISYLKSQNVVRLRDSQELPEMLESSYVLEPYSLNPYSYDSAQQDMLKANFKAVEELE